MKSPYKQFIYPQHGPFIKSVTESAISSLAEDLRYYFIFSQYQYTYLVRACALDDLDPTNTFFYPH